jgi:hypothetical protein
VTFKKPKTMSIPLTCPASMSMCRTTLSVATVPARTAKLKRLRKEIRLGSRIVVVPRGESATLTIRLSETNAKLVRQAGSVKIRALAIVRDDAGKLTTASSIATLRG